MQALISTIFMMIGTFFMCVAGIGIVKMPDLFLRMSATTKAATLGAGFMLLGAAVHFHDDFGAVSRMLATIIFLLSTAPVAAHMIARAAYRNDVPLWEGTLHDELRGRYEEDTHILASPAHLVDEDPSEFEAEL
jgi:multicomponent Na+:H+ antiporter subunit G